MSTYEMPKQETPESSEVAVLIAREICERFELGPEQQKMFEESLQDPSVQARFLSMFVEKQDLDRRIAEKEKLLDGRGRGDDLATIKSKYSFRVQESF
ncbi:MAG: hypothetical protein A2175_01120 [Candidatus Nealsonbacteria bacterium RBG_13_42_11]|uniref:Uncharacterized protein n=1 Tax=Candidatus Nealsonbacteria bacterium RBG_13_42_11 TaxID=1801663 RepID=A0A1G2DYQ2_9BACT|nr:MAG: hypothetical protein A2175_01120 [Candidatus Nealsonbacteria bacterium RBG_13_42_11]